MKTILAVFALSLAMPVLATERHAKPVIVVNEHDHEHTLVGALVGAGITYWIMRRRAKRAAPPPAQCEVRVERAEAACAK